MSMGKRHVKILTSIQREREVVRLRMQGYSFYQIGKLLNISHVTSYVLYKKAFNREKQLLHDTIEDARKLELMRLDEYMKVLHQQTIETVDGETPDCYRDRVARNLEILLKISERRSKLMGMDAPEKKVEVSVGIDLTQLSEEELIGEMEKLGIKNQPVKNIDYILPGEVIIPQEGCTEKN